MDTNDLWKLYSCETERSSTLLDEFGRIPSHAIPGRHAVEPVVSDILFGQGFRPRYPGGAPFAVCLSHDIDFLVTPTFREKAGTLRRGGLSLNAKNLLGLFRRHVDPRYSVDELIEEEHKVGARSSFYFLSLLPDDEDFNYSITEAGEQIARVKAAGNEVGLHGGHTAYRDAKALSREKKALQDVAGLAPAGYRNHYLRFSIPDTWKLLQAQGFAYDSTYGWSDRAGFRNGLCYPFRPIDPDTGEHLGIVELPLIFMDATLIFNMQIDTHQAWDLFIQLMNKVKACAGVMTVLWHNNYMQTSWGPLYARILQHLQREGAWFATGQELVDHWQGSGLMEQMEEAIKDTLVPRA